MSGLEPRHPQTPKTRPMSHKRSALVASLDIGTSKIACMIARLTPCSPNNALRGRTHAIELIGYSQIQSRGVKAGAVIDLAECERAVRHAVALAEGMAKVRVESVLLSVSGGRLQGQLVEASANVNGGAVTQADVARVTSAGMRHATGQGRTVLHALPVSYTLDGVKGIRDPRGMVARQFGVDMNVVTVDATVAKNLMLVVERCHLERRGDGGESLCRRPVGADRRRGRYRRRGDRDGGGNYLDRHLFGGTLRPRQRICGRRATHHHGSGPRTRRLHCGCRANQDVIWHRTDWRFRCA